MHESSLGEKRHVHYAAVWWRSFNLLLKRSREKKRFCQWHDQQSWSCYPDDSNAPLAGKKKRLNWCEQCLSAHSLRLSLTFCFIIFCPLPLGAPYCWSSSCPPGDSSSPGALCWSSPCLHAALYLCAQVGWPICMSGPPLASTRVSNPRPSLNHPICCNSGWCVQRTGT